MIDTTLYNSHVPIEVTDNRILVPQSELSISQVLEMAFYGQRLVQSRDRDHV
jgi:hypothetical protein